MSFEFTMIQKQDKIILEIEPQTIKMENRQCWRTFKANFESVNKLETRE